MCWSVCNWLKELDQIVPGIQADPGDRSGPCSGRGSGLGVRSPSSCSCFCHRVYSVQLAVSDVSHPFLVLCMVVWSSLPTPNFPILCVPSQSPCPCIGLHLLPSLILRRERMEYLRINSCSQCLVWYQPPSEHTTFIKSLLCAQCHARHEEASRRRSTPFSSSCLYTHTHTHTHSVGSLGSFLWWFWEQGKSLVQCWQLVKLLEEDFPGRPVVKILSFQCRGHRFNPWSRR